MENACSNGKLQSPVVRLQTVLENLNEGLVITDQQDQILYINTRMAKLTGYGISDILGQPASLLLAEIGGWPSLQHEGQEAGPVGICQWQEVQLKRPDGRQFWAEISITLLCDDQGAVVGKLISVADITERRWLEEYVRLLESVVINANEIVMITEVKPCEDPLELRIVYVNEAFIRATGYSVSEVIGKTPHILEGPDTSTFQLEQIRLALSRQQAIKSEMVYYRKDTHRFWVDQHIVPITNERGDITHYAAIMRETSDRKQVEEQLRRSALQDGLTGLPNRVLFMERLERTVGWTKRHPDYLFAVLFLDLDRFKVINDSLGHMVGDQLLVAIARRLETCLRATDTVARLGGDEFTILLEDIQSVRDALDVAERIHQALAAPFTLNGHEVFTSASIGIALSTTHYDYPEDLLRGADIAMYRAKARGKACHEVFDTTMHTHAVALLRLENDLRRAIERQEFHLCYQPIVALTSGRLIGFEALIRWYNPERGLVSPAEFIPVAEETGLIFPIGRWVMQAACQQLKQWQQQFPMNPPLSISINLSSKQFSQSNLIDQVKQVLAETNLDTHSLKLEITESAIMDNTESAMDMLLQLKAMGIQLSIDDFGTGYSSLSYLYRFPLDWMKIDRSFISRIDVDGDKLELVRTIITLAWNLGIEVVAEGVETRKQLAQLKALNCEYAQGHFFSKPLDVKETEVLLARHIPAPGVWVPMIEETHPK